MIVPNKHKIYYLGGGSFLIVYKVRGESPTRWQKTFLNSKELYNEITQYYGVKNAFSNYFTNNNELNIVFSLCNDYETFLQNIDKLSVNNSIKKKLHCEVHIHSIETYKKLDGVKVFDTIFNKATNKVYLFVK